MGRIIKTIIRWSLLGCTLVCAASVLFPFINNLTIQNGVEMHIGSGLAIIILLLFHILPLLYVVVAGILGAVWPKSIGATMSFLLSCIAALIMIRGLLEYSQHGLVLGVGFYIVLFVSVIATLLSLLQMILFINNKWCRV